MKYKKMRGETHLHAASKDSSNQWLRYTGMSGQFIASILIGLFIGGRIDRWIGFKGSWFIWLLPLFIIVGTLIYFVIVTNRGGHGNKKNS